MRRNVVNGMMGLFVAAAFGLAGCGSGGGGTTTAGSGGTNNVQNQTSAYLPVTVGSKWTYLDLSNQSTVTDEIQSDGKMKETISGTTTSLTITLTSDSTGIYLAKLEDIGSNFTRTYSQPELQWPTNVTTGAVTTSNYAYSGTTSETGSVKITVLGTESITVPAGTFNAVKIKLEKTNSSNSVTTSFAWYVVNVGPVQKADDQGVIYSKLTSYVIK